MRLPITPSEIAPRIATGAFILNSGLSKRRADETAAGGLHGFASGAYPFLKQVPPTTFARVLSTSEILIGAALLTPFVPTAVAGAALTGFSAGLVGLYLRTPGMTKPGKSVAPTQEGLPLAKDVWMLGIGIGLLTSGLIDRGGSTRTAALSSRNRAAATKGPRKSGRKTAKQGRTSAQQAAATAGKAAAKVREVVSV